MKANEAPKKIYFFENYISNEPDDRWLTHRSCDEDIEYVRVDAFIEKACKFLYKYNQKQVQKHGPKATLGCGEFTINVEDFRNYMKGE